MPVVTQCGHYFCERCALQHYSGSSTCFVCSKPTNGIFNEVPKKFAQKQQKVQQEESEGNQGSDDGDDITTRVGASSIAVKNKRVDSDDSEENGILSKADREVFEEYQNKKKEVDRKKYASQTGWFIP
ncbi:hypothetical protein FGO68_gene11429 [Halteria grandinella]|uniref:Zinc finger C3HC4 RING-type domain-containing protein n=1 Tax=Halteria grandinella TaxID=5974 RepID=A0A8J8P2U5_HALGN|nr:hypothetical protein FGO68_gene11429 [Halteria grandinella]